MRIVFFLLGIMTFLSCTQNSTTIKSDDGIKEVEKLAAEKIGEDFECHLNTSETYLLCHSVDLDARMKTPLTYFIYDLSNQKIIQEEIIPRGTVRWKSATILEVQTIPGISEEGKTLEDYTYEIDVIKLTKPNQP